MTALKEYIITASNSFYYNGDKWIEESYIFDSGDEVSEAYEKAYEEIQTTGENLTIYLISRSTPYDDNLGSYNYELTEEIVVKKREVNAE